MEVVWPFRYGHMVSYGEFWNKCFFAACMVYNPAYATRLSLDRLKTIYIFCTWRKTVVMAFNVHNWPPHPNSWLPATNRPPGRVASAKRLDCWPVASKPSTNPPPLNSSFQGKKQKTFFGTGLSCSFIGLVFNKESLSLCNACLPNMKPLFFFSLSLSESSCSLREFMLFLPAFYEIVKHMFSFSFNFWDTKIFCQIW